jgi:hypothetical protein
VLAGSGADQLTHVFACDPEHSLHQHSGIEIEVVAGVQRLRFDVLG